MPDNRYPCEANYYADSLVRRLRALRRQLRFVHLVVIAQLLTQIAILLTISHILK